MASFPFPPDPTTPDLRDFMDYGERVYWDNNQQDSPERTKRRERLEALWRSIPDPTEAELKQLMGEQQWGSCQRGENREDVLNFYRRKWKKDRKADAIVRRAEAEAETQPAEDNTPPEPERSKPEPFNMHDVLDALANSEAVKMWGPREDQKPHKPEVQSPELPAAPPEDEEDPPYGNLPTDAELLECMRPEAKHMFEKPETTPQERARILQGARKRWRAARKPAKAPHESEPPSGEFHKNAQGRVEIRHYPPSESPNASDRGKQLWKKFLSFIESPFFLLAAGGIFTLFGTKATFLIAWVLFSFAFYRTRFFDQQSPTIQRIGNGIAAVLIGLGLLGFWSIRFKPNSANPASQSKPSVASAPANPDSPREEERQFIDVELGYLLGLYQKYNTAQADAAVKTYIGKWIRVSGKVTDVYRDDPQTAGMSISAENAITVVAEFDQQRWIDRAIVFGRGEKVTIVGKIERIIQPGIILKKCEIVE